LDEYSVEEFTETPNVAENQNCSPEAKTVCQILEDWALTEPNVSKQAISRLCKSPNCVLPEVPCSYSGLIGQPQSNYARMCNGEYCHFPNWMESLKSLLMFHFNSCTGAVNYYLLINCDGLPLFRHSPDYKLNPILVSFFGVSMRPLCAGVYCTEQSKQREMPHPAIFLKQFLEDIQSLLDRPLKDGNVTFALQNKGIYVCDAPALASLKCIISQMGHSACERCTDVGMYGHTARHVCLTKVGCQLRTDQFFWKNKIIDITKEPHL